MSSAAKVGLFMLVILAVIGYFVLKIEDVDLARGRNSRKIRIAFDNVAGLEAKSAVRVAGVRKGKVTAIDVANGKATVEMEIDDDVPLFENASARVANLGLLGEKYIEIDPGEPKAGPLQGEVLRVPGGQPASIDDVTTQVSEIAKDVKAITESMRAVMTGPTGQQRLEDIVENVRQITAQMRELVAVNRTNVDATLVNMRSITEDLRVAIPRLAASIERTANALGGTVGENREDVRKMVDNLRTLSGELKITADNLNSVTGQMKSGEGTVGKLLYSDEAHERLTGALGAVESGVNELKNVMGRAGRIQLDLGLKADYYAGMKAPDGALENVSGSSRSAVTLRVVPNPALNRFYNIELSDDPRGAREDKVRIETRTDAATGQSTTSTVSTTKYTSDYLISAQAGWVLDDLALRVGLFDSAGGVGADYQFNDRIKATAEAFDFGGSRDANPHLRVFGEYTFRQEQPDSPRLFVTSGVDNPLNDTAFIVGAGIRWRDEDLKYLLGSIPLGR